MQEWTSDSLWEKAKLFAGQTMAADPDPTRFPLFASFTLEALGKAALAKVHPALIADPRGDGAPNILYAFGVPTKEPRTIVAKTIFARLIHFVDEFTSEDANACLILSERRNRQLHTGEVAYADFGSGQWLPDFYRALDILTKFLGRDLDELLGSARAQEARETNARTDKKIDAEVKKRVADCSRMVSALTPQELGARREKKAPKRVWAFQQSDIWVTAKTCPACQSKGSLTVKHIGDRPAEIEDASIFVQSIFSPRKFECGVCGLLLTGTQELRVAGLADQVLRTVENDPTEYFDIEPEPYDPNDDYGND